jgi:hypothetical protein
LSSCSLSLQHLTCNNLILACAYSSLKKLSSPAEGCPLCWLCSAPFTAAKSCVALPLSTSITLFSLHDRSTHMRIPVIANRMLSRKHDKMHFDQAALYPRNRLGFENVNLGPGIFFVAATTACRMSNIFNPASSAARDPPSLSRLKTLFYRTCPSTKMH